MKRIITLTLLTLSFNSMAWNSRFCHALTKQTINSSVHWLVMAMDKLDKQGHCDYSNCNRYPGRK